MDVDGWMDRVTDGLQCGAGEEEGENSRRDRPLIAQKFDLHADVANPLHTGHKV